ncbi:hypothetical protein CsatB_013692 [Cannabis sativa]
MEGFDGYKPAMAMVGLQCIYTGLALFTRAALLQGMSPRVFVVYRQGVATLIMAPIACFTRWRNPYNKTSLGLRSFCLIFITSLIGVTGNQNAYFEGLYLSSSTITTAMTNLLPVMTFVMATIVGMEKVNFQSFRSVAKIIGTIFSVGGAICMALVKGPKLLNTILVLASSISDDENLELGCAFLFISCLCWSFWIIMQVPISASCPDHLYSTLWMCLLTTIQSAIYTFVVEPDLKVWSLHSYLELGSCLYAGIGTAISFFVQAWCIQQRGPVFVAMFSPLCTVITAIIAALFLHEKLYVGSLVGALAVIIGLYIVLWGKAKDLEEIREETLNNDIQKLEPKSLLNNTTSYSTDLEQSLLPPHK